MARGDMALKATAIGSQVEILRRTPFEGVPITLDFTSDTDTDPETKEKLIKAGTPITKDGKPAKTTPFEGAVGILLHDVYESRPHGTILKKAYINSTVAGAHSGVSYDDALAKLFPMIVFEPDLGE